jgi:ankyrin repeat protein
VSDVLEAAANEDLATIKRLHAEGVDVTECGEDGFTAIMEAAVQGHATTVKLLQSVSRSEYN